VNGVGFDSQMPNPGLNDHEIAGVLSYVRNNFGNKGDMTTVAEVKAFRESLTPAAKIAVAAASPKKALPAVKPASYSKR